MGSRGKRSLDDADYYRQLLESAAQPSMAESFAAMLRGNQRREEAAATTTPRRALPAPSTPAGTTELDLHVAESLLVAGDLGLAKRCGAALAEDAGRDHHQRGRGRNSRPRLSSWPPSCVPHSLDAPSTLGLRARVSVDWYGQYTLLLGSRDKDLWEAPMLHCGPTSMTNPMLRSHLRRSVGLRFGILFNRAPSIAGASAAATGTFALALAASIMAALPSYLLLLRS